MQNTLPQFSKINPAQIEKNLEQLLNDNRAALNQLTQQASINSWEQLITPLEILDNKLSQFWAPINHLHSVIQTPALRTAYQNCLPKLTDYSTEIEQNESLYQAFKNLAASPSFKQLNSAQQKVIQDYLRDFHLAGIDLPADAKKRYAEIQTQLAELSNQFSANVLDATGAWTKHITEAEDLRGIPAHVLTSAQETAQAKGLTGWLLTLEYPCYSAVITYAQNQALREEIYTAYVTRASEQGPYAKQFDNNPVMAEILRLRHELSLLLGFKNYAELSLATKMVKNPAEVMQFLQGLIKQAQPKALAELQELTAFALKLDGLVSLQAWDIAYYSEKLKERQYSINDEMLRPYFPVQRVLTGMFLLIEKLYGMRVEEISAVDVWHSDARFFAIYDSTNQLRGQFYLDLFAREHKRDGAWMDDCQARWRAPDGQTQIPIAFLTCNLTPPTADKPALLTHDEVFTIFHEFGHGLHHMLTQIDYLDISGINGVEWDAVELPSQFMEYFLWEKSVLDMASGHYQTGEKLPDILFKRLRSAKDFQCGLQLLRQLEFSLFDFRLHLEYAPTKGGEQIQALLSEIYTHISVTPKPAFNRFQNSFSHIFAGGYAAGYYSYLWAEVLACDAYAKFKEHGVINAQIGAEFLHNILEQGGSKEAMELFIAFRGRKPTMDALLEERGFLKN